MSIVMILQKVKNKTKTINDSTVTRGNVVQCTQEEVGLEKPGYSSSYKQDRRKNFGSHEDAQADLMGGK